MLLVVVAVEVRRRDVLDDRHRFRVYRRPDFLHDGVEPVVVVRRVLDDAHASVGLVHAVRAVNDVAVPHLVLGLHVPGVGIVHAVIEGVSRVRLQQAHIIIASWRTSARRGRGQLLAVQYARHSCLGLLYFTRPDTSDSAAACRQTNLIFLSY